MVRLTFATLIPWLFVGGCFPLEQPRARTAAEHDRLADHYEATARSIEWQCGKDRRHEYSVADPEICWKANDRRFLAANIHAAEQHRAAAEQLRAAGTPNAKL